MGSPLSDDRTGRLVADRYRLDQRLRFHPSSWLAEDTELSRAVVLHRPASADGHDADDFLDEIEQAASLVHPNIAEIWNWGIDEAPWAVYEAAGGGTLADLLAAGNRLDPSQALVMALEAGRALEYAHDLGVVHGCVSPAWCHFGADQQLRLAGFGLRTPREPVSVVSDDVNSALALVRYQSPEQAGGRSVGPPTDVYTLALTLDEAVTGRPPEAEATVVATLLRRSESQAVVSDELGPLAEVLRSSGRVEPDARPSAGALSESLLATASQMPRPGALPLVGLIGVEEPGDAASNQTLSEGDVDSPSVPPLRSVSPAPSLEADLDDLVASMELAMEPPATVFEGGADDTGVVDAIPGTSPLSVQRASVDDERHMRDDSAQDQRDGASAAVGAPVDNANTGLIEAAPASQTTPAIDAPIAVRSDGLTLDEDDDEELGKPPRWPLIVLGLVLASFFVSLALWLSSDERAVADVPDVVGDDAAEAIASLESQNWEVRRLEGRLDGSEPGAIIAQNPEPGTELRSGEEVSVTVSIGNEMVEIPGDLAGLTIEQAAERLRLDALELGAVSQVNSEVLGAGLVVGVDEPTSQKPAGESVALRVSLGPVERVIPATVVGMPIGEVTAQLAALRLGVAEEQAYDPVVPAGVALGVRPEPGTAVSADSLVTVIVSAGPAPVTMPDVTDLSLGQARERIESLGLVFIDSEGTPGEPAVGTRPPAGEVVDVGTEVVVILDEPSEDDDETGDDEADQDETDDG